MIGKLYEYFGVVGMTSVVLWLGAAMTWLVCVRHRRRNLCYAGAVAASVLALVLGRVNSENVSAIQLDRTAEIEAARQAQERARTEAARAASRATKRFAEDGPGEGLGGAAKAGGGAGGVDAAAQPAPANGSAVSAVEPEYRKRGKQQREAGKRQPIADVAAVLPAEPEEHVRLMHEPDLLMANRLDRWNLFAARLALVLSTLLLGLDYLRRFNTTLRAYFPLPITGRWLDSLLPKTHSAILAASNQADVRAYLKRAVRKGETFLCFGNLDPWPDSAVPRLRAGPFTLWGLGKLVYGADDVPRGGEFVFDAVWFNRYCFVVPDPLAGRDLLHELCGYLHSRKLTGASARRTVNVVWAFETLPAPEDLAALPELSRDTNFKFLLVAAHPLPADVAETFEEVQTAAG